MGGEAGSAAAAAGSEGRVKSLGLVFEDERKGCYSSGETVAGHVLLEAAEPVALRALRLEAQGRATASWRPAPAPPHPHGTRLGLRRGAGVTSGRWPLTH